MDFATMDLDIYECAENGDLESLKALLLEGKVGVCDRDKWGEHRAVLELAAEYNQLPILQWLVLEGGAIRAQDIESSDLLRAAHYAALNDHWTTLAWLLEYGGVDLNEARVDGLKVWDILIEFLVDQVGDRSLVALSSNATNTDGSPVYVFYTAAVTIFLRTLILQSNPNYAEHTSRL
jgi:hypothetical protein